MRRINSAELKHGLSFCLSRRAETASLLKQTAILCPPGAAAPKGPDTGTSSFLDVSVCQSGRAVPRASAGGLLLQTPSQRDAAR
jgi:hypothetical protein